jgi:hypothetical protein
VPSCFSIDSLHYQFFYEENSPRPGIYGIHSFFGIALLDALHNFDWLRISFWLAIGLVFILADNMKKTERK